MWFITTSHTPDLRPLSLLVGSSASPISLRYGPAVHSILPLRLSQIVLSVPLVGNSWTSQIHLDASPQILRVVRIAEFSGKPKANCQGTLVNGCDHSNQSVADSILLNTSQSRIPMIPWKRPDQWNMPNPHYFIRSQVSRIMRGRRSHPVDSSPLLLPYLQTNLLRKLTKCRICR